MSKQEDLLIWISAICLSFMIFLVAVAVIEPAMKVREAEARRDAAFELASQMQMEVDHLACINGGECRAPAAR